MKTLTVTINAFESDSDLVNSLEWIGNMIQEFELREGKVNGPTATIEFKVDGSYIERER